MLSRNYDNEIAVHRSTQIIRVTCQKLRLVVITGADRGCNTAPERQLYVQSLLKKEYVSIY